MYTFRKGECDMSSLSTRQATCPPGSCCCSDPSEPNVNYCKPVSGEGGPCYAKAVEWPGSCPCPVHMTCVPNLQVPTWTSTYGRLIEKIKLSYSKWLPLLRAGSHADSDSQLETIELMPESIKVYKSSSTDDEQSLGGHDMEAGGDQILGEEGDLSVHHEIKEENDGNGHSMLTTGELSDSHILPVEGNEPTMLTEENGSIAVTANLPSDMAGATDHDVIQFLMPTSTDEGSEAGHAGVQQTINLNLDSVGLAGSQVLAQPTQTVQAITLADGNTAFIQHPSGAKFLEGQTITLEDGTTAVVQAVTSQVPSLNLLSSMGAPSMGSGDPVSNPVVSQHGSLEDPATSFINQAVKDGLQAIILEDGTTAYLATQPSPLGGLVEGRSFEPTTLTLDQLTTQVSAVQGVLSNGILTVDPLNNDNSQVGHVATVGAFQETVSNTGDDKKPGLSTTIVQNFDGDKVSQLILEKGYRCKFEGCGRYYTTLHHLRVHERSHTGDRPFKCDYEHCGKAFATGYGLKSHMRVHTGEKPYKCPQQNCDKAFKTSGDLQKHVRTHTGERPFKCPFVGCDRSFTTSNIRKVHIRTHTGERPYICPEEDCGRSFASATNYKNHVRIHTGEKPYVCTVLGCGKRFTEYSSLYKHHVVHTHSKPYTCDRCGKTYRQTSTLAMHKRTAHGENVTAESEALLFQQQQQQQLQQQTKMQEEQMLGPDIESLEPLEKRPRLNFINTHEQTDEGEGALVINTSEQQQFAFVGGDGGVGVLANPLTDHTLLQQGGLAFTLGDNTQQVYVITDPAQLEALQQIAKHQLDTDGEDNPLLTPVTSSVQMPLDTTGMTMVTEIDMGTTSQSDIPPSAIINSAAPSVTCIDNI
ncbi:ZNF76-like protein [Mya arenaria]|uniref:ZNF76-like protein n=1 Tax=Mya arenaria TaxID=6604 RepID=A0ABY7E2P6_MYAAR|nr:ZNF76-like protein [Mya arenaria]